MISNLLHYIWLGPVSEERRSKLYERECSWREALPCYTLCFWDENTLGYALDKIPEPARLYFERAMDNKFFAAASNLARLAVLYSFGGVYVDTDVEILKKFDLSIDFIGFQRDDMELDCLNTAVMGCHRESYLSKLLLDGVDDSAPYWDAIWLACSLPTERIYKENGLLLNKTQRVNDFVVYDKSYFHPFRWDELGGGRNSISDNTVTIHWWDASWK